MDQMHPLEEIHSPENDSLVLETKYDLKESIEIKIEELDDDKFNSEDLHHSIDIKEESDTEHLTQGTSARRYIGSNLLECEILDHKVECHTVQRNKGSKRKRKNSLPTYNEGSVEAWLLQATNVMANTSKSILNPVPVVQDDLNIFGQTIVNEMKQIKCKKRLQKLKRRLLDAIFDCQNEED